MSKYSRAHRGCWKRTYRNRIAAMAAMAMDSARGLRLRACYQCPRCGGWHLTSQEQRR